MSQGPTQTRTRFRRLATEGSPALHTPARPSAVTCCLRVTRAPKASPALHHPQQPRAMGRAADAKKGDYKKGAWTPEVRLPLAVTRALGGGAGAGPSACGAAQGSQRGQGGRWLC